MGCFCSQESKPWDLGNQSYRESSPYEQMEEETHLSEENLRVFGIEEIEYADHDRSSEMDEDIHCRRKSDDEDRYQDTSWRRAEEISDGYENAEEF